jgi:hypothetical protein
MKELNIKAIFDNAGGLILHLGDSYSHFYLWDKELWIL